MKNTKDCLYRFADISLKDRFSADSMKMLCKAARIAVEVSLKVMPGERVLVIANPELDSTVVSQALYDACLEVSANPVLVFQPRKSQFDFADPVVNAAINSRPDVIISISSEKMGKDPQGIAKPYEFNGIKYDSIFHLIMDGEKCCRSFWSPSVTIDSFIRTVPLDYTELKRKCEMIKNILDKAIAVKVTAPGGTDITIGLCGRTAKSDDGDFSLPGSGGNLPAGETFISPENGTAQGVICFDGSISTGDGTIIIYEPIKCTVENGYVKDVSGGSEADILLKTIIAGEKNALELESCGKLQKGMGEIYARNARNIGELGIGLNPKAVISGNMLEDEKAFKTCHFAIGMNYDDDAPSLIHLDGLVKNPTITAIFDDGSEQLIEKDGELITGKFSGKKISSLSL